MSSQMMEEMPGAIELLKSSHCLVPNITNTVSQNLVANVELALGASPVMFNMPDEAREFISIAKTAYINLGTVIPIYEKTILVALQTLKERKIPWVLDPVAVGFGELRTNLFKRIFDEKIFPAIIRGNASEIITLADMWHIRTSAKCGKARGVDTLHTTQDAETSAIALSRLTGGIVAMSGETDFVTDGAEIYYLDGGSAMMEQITGMGCSLGGAIASFLTVASPLHAALLATTIYKIAGKISANEAKGLGDFTQIFINRINQIDKDEFFAKKVFTKNKLCANITLTVK